MTVAFLGLYGPSGALPPHYTQLLLDLGRDVRGPERRSLRDWLDLFNHRIISHFYRAWEKYRFWMAYERGQSITARPDAFTTSVASLVGLGTPGLQNRLVVRAADTELDRINDLSLLYYSGYFVQRPRNASNLRSLVGDYFGVAVEVRQFHGQWLELSAANQTSLGTTGSLGVDAVAGSRVWDVGSKFRLRIGPLSYPRFEDFLPDPEAVPQRKRSYLLAMLTRLFVGPELDFDVQLVLDRAEVPDWPLGTGPGAGPRLGWNVWLFSSPPSHDPDDCGYDCVLLTDGRVDTRTDEVPITL
jgi:type VI secretion system protein ImpH